MLCLTKNKSIRNLNRKKKEIVLEPKEVCVN